MARLSGPPSPEQQQSPGAPDPRVATGVSEPEARSISPLWAKGLTPFSVDPKVGIASLGTLACEPSHRSRTLRPVVSVYRGEGQAQDPSGTGWTDRYIVVVTGSKSRVATGVSEPKVALKWLSARKCYKGIR